MGLAVSPAIASAADGESGWRTPPVQWFADGNDNCEVDFTILNSTNARTYAIDYIVDGEDPKEIEGAANITGTTFDMNMSGTIIPRTVGRIGTFAYAAVPAFPDGGYITNRDPADPAQQITKKINIGELPDLPNPELDTHTITYQMVLGPENKDKGWDPEEKTFAKFTTTVSGCAEAEDEDNGSLGSGSGSGSGSSFGSVFGSLFGSLGSSDATAPKLGSS